MGRSDSDLRTISPIWRFQKNMLSMRIILCSVLLAVVISAADKEETKSLSETESLDRVIRAGGEGNRRRKKSNDRRRKRKTKAARKRSRKSGVGKRRLNRRRGDRKRSKGRKESRRKNKNFRTSASLRNSRSSGLNETCLIQAVFFMKLWKDTVANYQKQKSRMTKQNSTGSGKSGKKGLFAPIAHRLVDIGGGNKTNMSCGGEYGNKGAAQLQNLTKTLFDCEIDVNKSCNPSNFPKPNTTLTTLCDSLVSSFTTATTACLNKSFGSSKTNVSDACGCWVGPILNNTAQSLKQCKTSSSASAITKQLNKCKTAFGTCRKYEDDALTAIMSCVTSTAQQTAKATVLSVNNASMTAAKAKMSSLAGSSSGRRRMRATAASCAEVISKSEIVISYANSFPSSSKIYTISKEISSASVTCTEAEKSSLTTQVTSMESAITQVSNALVAVQEQIKTISGSTASSAQLTTSMTTSAPSRRRGKEWIKS